MSHDVRSRPSAGVRWTSRLSPCAALLALSLFASVRILEVPPLARRLPRVVDEVVIPLLSLLGLVFLLLALAGFLLPRRNHLPPRPVQSPVRGRWQALNSPASKVPSHGMHTFGQTYAIDVVYEPKPGSRPAFGKGFGLRRPRDYPAFGQPVHAPADGTVLVAKDGARDHLSRSAWPILPYFLVEGSLRELGQFFGTGWLLGNQVIIDLHDGSYALMAHLQKNSTTVTAGDTVQAGQIIAACGNSGNSSEPHVHFQLMDHRRSTFAAGLPFTFTNVQVEGNPQAAVPANTEFFQGIPVESAPASRRLAARSR